MQGNESPLEAFAPEFTQVPLGGIEGMGIHTHTPQGVQHASPRHQRHLALGGMPAHEHGHLAQGFGIDCCCCAHALTFLSAPAVARAIT